MANPSALNSTGRLAGVCDAPGEIRVAYGAAEREAAVRRDLDVVLLSGLETQRCLSSVGGV